MGSMWALGSFGGHFSFPGRAALGAAGGLWAGANAGNYIDTFHYTTQAKCFISGGAAFAAQRDGLVLKVDVLVGFSDLKYALRREKESYRLVLL